MIDKPNLGLMFNTDMAIIVQKWLVILRMQLTESFTKYPPVIKRLNFGLTFKLGPELDIILGHWLQLYAPMPPESISKVPMKHM